MDDKYEVGEFVGAGRFGTVFKASDRVTGQIVAVKKMFYKVKHGVPCSIIREVSILKELDHENIVRLLDVLPNEKEISLVFEYFERNLHSFIKFEPEIDDPQVVKKFLHQILSGVAYCHAQKILHRDLKPENILVDIQNMVVKLADFGTSRDIGVPRKAYTAEVASLWHRAPEILLGDPHYSSAMDIWSVGCIFAEMVKGREIFRGHGPSEQIKEIFRVLGMPDEETWPGVMALLHDQDDMWTYSPKDLAKEVRGLEPNGVELLSEMLRLNPSKRITAHDALKHPYFYNL